MSVSSSPSAVETPRLSVPCPPVASESEADVELASLCTALETALLPRTAGTHTPPRFNLERAVRLSIPSAGISLNASQSQRVRRACAEPGGLPALLRAIGDIATLTPHEVARRILRSRSRTSSPRVESPRRPNGASSASTSPRSPVLLSVARFAGAFHARVVDDCVAMHRALWNEVFERYADSGRWNIGIFENVVRKAKLHKGPLSRVMEMRVECIAEKGWDKDAALKSVAFVALHRARNGPQRLSAAELPPVVEGALRAAFAAMAVAGEEEKEVKSGGCSVASTPETGSPMPVVQVAAARSLFEGVKGEDEDEAFAAMVNIPLRASIGHVLETSAEKREQEVRKARAFADVLNGRDDIAELKEEIGRLRETVVDMDQRQQRQWGIGSVLGVVVVGAGLTVSAVVAAGAAEAAGVFGDALPFVEQGFSAFI